MVAIPYEKFQLVSDSTACRVALVSAGLLLGTLLSVGITLVSLNSGNEPHDPRIPQEPVPTPRMKNFTLITGDKMNWFEALTDCYRRGLRLASVESDQEHQLLVDQIFTTVPDLDYFSNFWLSGTDLGRQGEYVWMTTGEPLNFTSWHSNEPNHGTRGGETEHCILMWKDYGFWWNDDKCSLRNFYVCEDTLTPSYNKTSIPPTVSHLPF